jgi:TRAP-type C4-dicarboxylate transport system permease large subunit
MLLEGFPAIIILVPLVLPVALKYGVDPVHLGILFLANLQLGIFLPPVGMNLFIASMRFDKPVLTLCARRCRSS